ncbi:pantetheine-phosphate adenylyltransferase [Peijinzhouia sedimentorum]|tara:strand:- start:184 stop:645 length:462 start_codon:yes stop_codon:yes gene_type:complete
MTKRIALFPGSFDPFTNGHHDIVMRGLNLFDHIIVAIGYNSQKQRYFDVDLMVKLISETFENTKQVSVIVYNELTAELAKKHKAKYVLRGLRNTTDFEYENTIAQVNHHLNPEMETVFLITTPEFAGISSTIIREVHRYKGDVSKFLPYKLEV